jgi:plastocyanin
MLKEHGVDLPGFGASGSQASPRATSESIPAEAYQSVCGTKMRELEARFDSIGARALMKKQTRTTDGANAAVYAYVVNEGTAKEARFGVMFKWPDQEGECTSATMGNPPSAPTTNDSRSTGDAASIVVRHATVQMIGGVATPPRFQPETVTVATGGNVTFALVSGIHGLAFDQDSIPSQASYMLDDNMPTKVAFLKGPLLAVYGESFVLSLSGLRPGDYPFFCPRHGMQMRGVIRVR